jgi:hypothetical protein
MQRSDNLSIQLEGDRFPTSLFAFRLAAACGFVDDDGCWYAFSPRDRKYKNGARPKRSVVDESDRQLGYWKSNTKLAYVVTSDKDEGAAIGNVTSLTFHVGQQPRGTQTPWKMKEYAIPENQHAPDGSVMRVTAHFNLNSSF